MTFLRMMLLVSLATTVMGCLEMPEGGERLAEFVEESTEQSIEVITARRQYEWEGIVSITIWDPTDASVGTCALNVETGLYGPLL